VSLAGYLQESFLNATPAGWRCLIEHPVFSPDLQQQIGFCPRADVVLEHSDTERRVWIEFEISRADPGANHLKFAVGHVFSPQPETDTFVSIVSNHVARGRANLGASAILLMRHVGMNAFQVPLLPQITGAEVKRLNHLSDADLASENVDVNPELERALLFTEPFIRKLEMDIFFVANNLEVAMNVRRWNEDVRSNQNAGLWGRRTITYFVYDPTSQLFAPSKFCAFMPQSSRKASKTPATPRPMLPMTIANYCSLDQSTPKFDGGAAQKHLHERLGYVPMRLNVFRPRERFSTWARHHSDLIRVRNNDPIILAPTH
jgi:hypothetical protein